MNVVLLFYLIYMNVKRSCTTGEEEALYKLVLTYLSRLVVDTIVKMQTSRRKQYLVISLYVSERDRSKCRWPMFRTLQKNALHTSFQTQSASQPSMKRYGVASTAGSDTH